MADNAPIRGHKGRSRPSASYDFQFRYWVIGDDEFLSDRAPLVRRNTAGRTMDDGKPRSRRK